MAVKLERTIEGDSCPTQMATAGLSMGTLAGGRIFEGERDYGGQTLATLTLQRSHFLRGIVVIVLVNVQVQGAKVCFVFVRSR